VYVNLYLYNVAGMIAHKPHQFHYFLWEYYFLLPFLLYSHSGTQLGYKTRAVLSVGSGRITATQLLSL